MANAVWIISFELKQGVTKEQFLEASQKVQQQVLSQQPGYLSWKQLKDGDTWVDLVTWQTMEDAKKAMTAGSGNPAAAEFYALLDMKTCKMQVFAVERDYEA